MKISVDFTETYAMFNAVQKNEFPFAASQAMNFVMKKTTQEFLPEVMDRYIDKGATPYTKRGFFAYYTKKNRLSGYIAAKDKNEYLDILISYCFKPSLLLLLCCCLSGRPRPVGGACSGWNMYRPLFAC